MNGLHLTADLHECAPESAVMTEPDALRAHCLAAVRQAGLQVVGELFHRFSPLEGRVSSNNASSSTQGGVTGVVLLAESHLAVHTWPERGSVTLDVYVCNLGEDNSARAYQVLDTLVPCFSPSYVERHALQRGQPGVNVLFHAAVHLP